MTIIEIIFPVFAIALLGYLLAFRGGFGTRAIAGISRYVFTVALPVMLFDAMANIELPDQPDWAFLLSYYLVVILLFLISMLIGRRLFGLSAREQSIFAMGSVYSNAVLIGLPLISAGLGEQALLPLFTLISIHGATLFFVTTLFAERDGDNGRSPLLLARQTLASLAKNPIIIGLFLGLLVNLLDLPIPTAVNNTIEIIAKSALPCALFVLGASLSAYKLAGHFREAWTIVTFKLLLQPLLVWFLAFVVFRVDPLWGSVAVMLAGMPTGVNVTVFAQKYQACIPTISSAVLISTTLAILTQSLLLAFFI